MAQSAPLESAVRETLAPLLIRPDLEPLFGHHILATGCTGYVGAWLLRAIDLLNARGGAIRVTALSRAPARFLAAHPALAEAPWLRVAEASAASACADDPPTLAIIGATPSSPAKSLDAGSLLVDTVSATSELLSLTAAWKCHRVLCMSSGAVLSRHNMAAADHMPDHGLDAYACSKRAMELMALASMERGGPPVIIARLHTFCGPWLPLHLAVSQFLLMASRGQTIRLAGDGSAVRSYLHGADLAVWLLVLLSQATEGGIFELGSDRPITLLRLAELISLLFGVGEAPMTGPSTPEPRPNYLPRVDKLKARFGLDVWTPLELALLQQFEWIGTAVPEGAPR